MIIGDPLLIRGEGSGTLSRIPWSGDAQQSFSNEDALQQVVDHWPEILPVREFYPQIQSVCSLGREIRVPIGGGEGAIDNLILTDDGHLVIVETKLCKNPDAVRDVVAQGLQYCMGISQLSAEEFEDRLKGCKILGPSETFVELTSRLLPDRADDFDEAFDRLRQNGDILLLIVGDRIRPSVERLIEWMNKTVGSAPYRLGLIELRSYELADVGRIIVPRTLSRVSEATRHVVTISLQGPAKEQVIATITGPSGATGTTKPASPMTEEALTAQIRAKNPPETAALVEELRAKLRSFGVKSRSLLASISYGVEVEEDFITLLSIGVPNMWFQLPRRAINALGGERFVACKQKINSVVNFYRPEDVSDPSKSASLCPRFQVLEGKVDALVEAFNEVAEDVKQAVEEAGD